MISTLLPGREELASPAFFQNPYPYYERLRSVKEPYWLPHHQETSSGGVWLFSRYKDGVHILKTTKGISKNLRSIRPPGSGTAFDMNVLHRDGDDHFRLRRLVADYFSSRSMTQLRPAMQKVAVDLQRQLLAKGEADFISEFAEPMPLSVVASLIGIPLHDMSQVRKWSIQLADGFDSLLSDPHIIDRQNSAMAEFLGYVDTLIESRFSKPDTSLLGFLATSCGTRLDREELSAMVGFLLFAGHETTVNLIGSMVWLLLSHPEQLYLLRKNPDLLPAVVEETLRYESPEQRSSFRIVTETRKINGHQFQSGQQIGVILGSMNRDESVFEHANIFDIRRNSNRHLAFGMGEHNCLGKLLARTEAQVALQTLVDSLPAYSLVNKRPLWRRNSFIRGLQTLRLRQH